MAVLCPTKVMVVDTMEHENPQDSLYENLWIIHDKDSFDNCEIPLNDSRKLLTCNDPHSLKYKTIVFNLYSASNTQVAFAKEKYYYFLCKFAVFFFNDYIENPFFCKVPGETLEFFRSLY